MASRMIPGEWTPRRPTAPMLVQLVPQEPREPAHMSSSRPLAVVAAPALQTNGWVEGFILATVLMAITIATLWGASVSARLS